MRGIVEAPLTGYLVIPVGRGADVVLEMGVHDSSLPLVGDRDRIQAEERQIARIEIDAKGRAADPLRSSGSSVKSELARLAWVMTASMVRPSRSAMLRVCARNSGVTERGSADGPWVPEMSMPS